MIWSSAFFGAKQSLRGISVAGGLAGILAAATLAPVAAQASSVTFTWDQMSTTDSALSTTGSLTLTSSLLSAADATGAAQFNLTLPEIAAAHETAVGEVSAFSFNFGPYALSTSNVTSNSTGWSDPTNILASTWAASKQFTSGPFGAGTLSMAGNSTNNGLGQLVTATMGGQQVTGEWVLTPVPLPPAAWLLLSGAALLFGLARGRGGPSLQLRS